MQRRKRRSERKKQRNIIILSTILLSFTLITAYSAFSTKLSITAKGNTIDRSRTIQSWSKTSNEDFHTDFYKENIVTATFLDTAKVPETAVKDWDVSVNKDRGVMAYVTESKTETGKYDLFIGAKDGVIANEDSSNLFYNFVNITTIDFKNNFDTSNTVNMFQMFRDCHSLLSVNVETFNTKNVTNMGGMFDLCWSIEYVDVSTFNTSNVTSMYAMFSQMYKLKRIDVSNFDTHNVENMKWMFNRCELLENLDLSSFNTSKVTTMYSMFTSDKTLTELNLCSFDTARVTNMYGMFASTTNLTKVKVGPNWTTTNAGTTSLFKDSGVSSVTTGEC